MTPPPSDRNFFRKLLGHAADLLFPCHCAVCEVPTAFGRSLCDSCHADLPLIRAPFCETCGEMYDGAIDRPFQCPHCHGLRFEFSFARAALARDPRTLDLIHRLKYAREIHLAPELGKLAVRAFSDPRLKNALRERWPLVPVPLHVSRRRQRQFNQAAEIARILAAETGNPVFPALARTRRTETQTLLSRRQRMQNMKGAFTLAADGKRRLQNPPPGALLVDDVFTTGSTVHECARILRRAGIREIAVITIMRG